jgi:hypothetical protein
MALADAVSVVVHLLTAGIWTGSVIFVTVAVLPLARSGDINAEPLSALTTRLTTLSRASALVLFLTGGHLAGTRYTVGTLTGSTPGYLVLAMLGLWLVLTALVEIGASRLTDGANRSKVREPARAATRLFQAATVVALALLVVGGLLSGGLASLLA